MKHFIYSLLFIAALAIVGIPASSQAAVIQFTRSLGYGTPQRAEVMQLQQFLIDRGYLNSAVTGNYLSLTKKAVQAFQLDQGIETTGYFGPKTRTAANKILLATTRAAVAVQSVTPETVAGAAVIFSGSRIIRWQTSTYPGGVGVDINLLRKVSNSPTTFTLVRQIAKDTPNTGKKTWIPSAGETGNDLYIEVTCTNTYQFKQGCQAGKPFKVF